MVSIVSMFLSVCLTTVSSPVAPLPIPLSHHSLSLYLRLVHPCVCVHISMFSPISLLLRFFFFYYSESPCPQHVQGLRQIYKGTV